MQEKKILKKRKKYSIVLFMQKTKQHKRTASDGFQFVMFGVILLGAGAVIRVIGTAASLFSKKKG